MSVRIVQSSWRFIAAVNKLFPCRVELSRSRTVVDTSPDPKLCSGLKHVLGPDADNEQIVALGQLAGGAGAKRGELK